MQCRFANAQLITTVENAWLPGREPHRIVDHGAVHRTEIFDEKCFAFEPDACMSPGNLCLRIETRKIDLRKDV